MEKKLLTKPMLERLVNIHEKIKSGSYPNTKELAKLLEVGTATISRDIDFLRDRFYAPIEYDSSIKGYYYSEDFDLPLNVLSGADMEVLTSAKNLLAHFKGTPIHDQLCEIIDVLAPGDDADNTTGNKSGNKVSMINRIAVPPVSQAFYDKKIWADIYESMKTNQIIEFDYSGLWSQESAHCKVEPYQLVMDDGMGYLLGYSIERRAVRMFSLTRISNVFITPDTFELPEDYDFGSRFDGGKFGFYFVENKCKYKIRFFGVSKEVVKEQLWADDQVIEEGKNYVDLTFSSNQGMKVLHWILSLGYTVKPLEPEWLVELDGNSSDE